jgi:hypothetical protein
MMTLQLTAREVANFCQCSEEDLRQAIAQGHHFSTLADAFRHFERKHPSSKKKFAKVMSEDERDVVALRSAIFRGMPV